MRLRIRETRQASAKAVIILSGAVLCLGCSTSSGPSGGRAVARIATTLSTYRAGDSIEVTIENIGLVSIGYSSCPLLVDRATGLQWSEVGVLDWYEFDACELLVQPMAPGETRSLRARLNPDLTSGTYRLRFEGLRPKGELSLESRTTNPSAVQ